MVSLKRKPTSARWKDTRLLKYPLTSTMVSRPGIDALTPSVTTLEASPLNDNSLPSEDLPVIDESIALVATRAM